MPMVSERSRRIAELEDALNEFTLLKEGAFKIFDAPSIKEIWEEYWKKIFKWNNAHLEKRLPYLYANIGDVVQFYYNVLNDYIDRKEFAERFEKICETIESYIKELQALLEVEKQKLDELYDEFVQGSGDLRDVFETPDVRNLILNRFLKM